MTKVSAEISNNEARGKITLENLEEKIEEIEKNQEVFKEGMKVKLTNGKTREMPVNEAVEEIWAMVYEIKEATEILVDIKKFRVLLAKYKNGFKLTLKVCGVLLLISVMLYFGYDLKLIITKLIGI